MSLKLTCLGTGSKGNCWIADYDGELLIIDAGISIKKIKQGIDYNLIAVQGVLISHAHHDHSMAVEDIKGCGLSVFEPFTVDCKVKTYGHYRIQAFPVPHGDRQQSSSAAIFPKAGSSWWREICAHVPMTTGITPT